MDNNSKYLKKGGGHHLKKKRASILGEIEFHHCYWLARYRGNEAGVTQGVTAAK